MTSDTATSAHTAGPWIVMHDNQVWMERNKSSDCSIIATCGGFALGLPDKNECEANARLIAAAPKLLEACKHAVEVYDSVIHSEYDGTKHLKGMLRNMDLVRDAISKAS